MKTPRLCFWILGVWLALMVLMVLAGTAQAEVPTGVSSPSLLGFDIIPYLSSRSRLIQFSLVIVAFSIFILNRK